MVRVKCCGITSEADAELCVAEGAHALGFVVEYPFPVPWSLPRDRAAALMARVAPFVSRVAVVGGDAATVAALAAATGADAVQLHYDEPEPVVEAVAKLLSGSGTRVIKALRIDSSARGKDPEPWIAAGRRFHDAGADALVLDARASTPAGGTGMTFDWAIAAAVARASACPVILAGGLNPANVARAIGEVRPHGVDVITALETPDHRKDPAKVRAFLAAATGR